MRSPLSMLPATTLARAARALLGLPDPVLRVLGGRPIRVDGQVMAPTSQLVLRIQRFMDTGFEADQPATRARADFGQLTRMLNAAWRSTTLVRRIVIPGRDGPIPAALHEPRGLPEGSPLLVFLHGGGWVIGDPDSHDVVCRFLAEQAEVRVLSVDYRLAPEHPFPAAVQDAEDAFRHAVEHAAEWGADPAAVAVGGDSAGGNLSAALGVLTSRADGPRPAFLLLIYPATDATRVRRSRRLFAEGFLLGERQIDWFLDHYAPDRAAREDPRLSPLLADDLSGLPPTYVATAGFDPLRDEGEEFAERLRQAGVPVAVRRHRELFHGFANMLGIDRHARAAMLEAAGALRAGLAFGRGRFRGSAGRPLQ
ncbi:acetyl esterase [Streptoalloteichus tenebrarius]|uniref:Acetyl esterase n=1 Tax=Streptoalloteichus tenebrarius (strain ATCC 17920 / DSM 40477 / JCM 4838 / CBS 697.72 / NBRC 16177 / NCIMB 11028 / NRRL B-12390 / A12253. 1 / ISP 5477) TaxID=1933 RepID=A0ABT1HYE6_STRSD|nr:alpha/beta hydrolase [Streptoalloteichus tenebrarius]MCP2260548.1 acetyl esterase [Streptoalloteichus tenebrarius]BFF01888.1 alpha/beta hydrolase [Streptoalloteichus tenebrarius]